MTDPIETYISELRDIRSSGAAVKETSYYSALSKLMNDIIPMQSISGGTLILLSTPWGKRRFFYEAWAGMKGQRPDPPAYEAKLSARLIKETMPGPSTKARRKQKCLETLARWANQPSNVASKNPSKL